MLTGPTAAIVTATVAVSFGSYASAMFAGQSADRAKVFAALIVVAMTVVNIGGSELGAKAQTVIVYVVLGILALFAVVTILNMTPSLLAPSGYPPLREIMSSVALTFFAFLGSWGGDLHRQGPGPAVPPAAQGHVPGARDRHGDLCRHRPGGVRHLDGGQGDFLGRHGAGRGRRA